MKTWTVEVWNRHAPEGMEWEAKKVYDNELDALHLCEQLNDAGHFARVIYQ